MLISYARSSSLNNLDYCEQQYFLQYNLGLKVDSNKKTTCGTMVHKVLECLAILKREFQKTNKETISIEEEALGKIEVSFDEFMKSSVLSNEDVDNINKTRINKSVFVDRPFIKYGHERLGRDFVNSLIVRSYEYYEKLHDDWQPIDFKNIVNWTWMALDYSEQGEYDPRLRTILEPEKQFDIVIDKPWAKYEYEVQGKKIKGVFGIKGTIDLITEIGPDRIEIIDWKTGSRKNWATGEEKTYEKLCNDKQLMLYYYAASKLFPKAKQIIITIFFIRDGGPFTICFDESNIPMMESILKNHFETVRANVKPKLIADDHSDFKCAKLCSFCKKNWPGTRQNICHFIRDEINLHGMSHVIDKYKDKNFKLDSYSAPGE